ncbi:hypothetical protein ABIB73_001760 [Bradyrhizobium sp. F1.4.3]
MPLDSPRRTALVNLCALAAGTAALAAAPSHAATTAQIIPPGTQRQAAHGRLGKKGRVLKRSALHEIGFVADGLDRQDLQARPQCL